MAGEFAPAAEPQYPSVPAAVPVEDGASDCSGREVCIGCGIRDVTTSGGTACARVRDDVTAYAIDHQRIRFTGYRNGVNAKRSCLRTTSSAGSPRSATSVWCLTDISALVQESLEVQNFYTTELRDSFQCFVTVGWAWGWEKLSDKMLVWLSAAFCK